MYGPKRNLIIVNLDIGYKSKENLQQNCRLGKGKSIRKTKIFESPWEDRKENIKS